MDKTNDDLTKLNKWAHGFLGSGCFHENVSRNEVNPLSLDCSGCGRNLTQREYHSENWNCRHSEQEPKFGAVRACKFCGETDVSFDVMPARPDYCEDLNLAAKLEAAVIERVGEVHLADCLHNICSQEYFVKFADDRSLEWHPWAAMSFAPALTRVRACFAAVEADLSRK